MTLAREIELVQNPALGAVIEWKFCQGYSPDEGELRGIPLALMFIVLPICLTKSLLDLTMSTREGSGLRKFEEKLRGAGADRVWAISDRSIAYRSLTSRSLALALATKLLRLETDTATLWVNQTSKPKGISPDVLPMIKAAERLGAWCGGHALNEVAAILRVQF